MRIVIIIKLLRQNCTYSIVHRYFTEDSRLIGSVIYILKNIEIVCVC